MDVHDRGLISWAFSLPFKQEYPACRYDLKSFGHDLLLWRDITDIKQLVLPEHFGTMWGMTSVPQPMCP